MRIQNKLTYNNDHFFTNAFKIIFIITRFEEKINKRIFFKYRYHDFY